MIEKKSKTIFTDHAILHIENLEESTRKLLELINESAQMVDKMNITDQPRSYAIAVTTMVRETKKTISFKIRLKKNQTLSYEFNKGIARFVCLKMTVLKKIK